MDAKKTAALEVILAALAVRDEDQGAEFPDELHARMIDAALDSIAPPEAKMVSWLQIADVICHGPLRRRPN